MKNLVATAFRLLTFRLKREEMLAFGWEHLIFGLICAWIAGIGRYWDNLGAEFLQKLGLGSIIYVFALSLLLWFTVLPLKPKNWSYFRVCAFVSLVSPPAILYAIPVEQFFSLQTSQAINGWFLAIVASWRLALLFLFLRRFAQIDWVSVVTATLLPMTLIVNALAYLNLEKAVFNLMGGFNDATSNDGAFFVLLLITLLSYILLPFLILTYLTLTVRNLVVKKNADG